MEEEWLVAVYEWWNQASVRCKFLRSAHGKWMQTDFYPLQMTLIASDCICVTMNSVEYYAILRTDSATND